MLRSLDVATAWLAAATRNPTGRYVGKLGPRPEKTLVIYEFEGCPFCRKVREALTMLDLDAEIRPCPKGGTRFRSEVIAKGGKAQFPYLEDPNTGKSMYESDDIIDYLYQQYGADRPKPLAWKMPYVTISGGLISAMRAGGGAYYRKARIPAHPLELYNVEISPYCRIVRETLSELELPYLSHEIARGSSRRPAYIAISGKMQVPFLIDPNPATPVKMFESADIKAYLNQTYALT